MTDNSALPEIGALVERLRAIPVWMVGEMTPGWQEHGTTAYEAADTLATLLQSLTDLTRERDEARAALNRQADNMAFVLNHATLPDQYYSKFSHELAEDRSALRTAEVGSDA